MPLNISIPRVGKNLMPKRDHDTEVEENEESLDAEEGHTSDDVLRKLGLSVETQLSNDILTGPEIRKVRFREATEGYYYPDVEAFVDRALKAVEWLTRAVEQRDRDIHALAVEYDQIETALTNAKFDLELFSARKDKVLVDEEGKPVTSDSIEGRLYMAMNELEEVRARLQQSEAANAEARAHITHLENNAVNLQAGLAAPAAVAEPEFDEASYQARIAELQAALETAHNSTAVATDGALEDSERQELIALREWATQVEPAYNEMEQSYEEMQRLLEAKDAELAEMAAQPAPMAAPTAEDRGQLDALMEQNAALQERVEALEEYARSMETYAEQLNAHIDTLETAATEAVEAAHQKTVEVVNTVEEHYAEQQAQVTDDVAEQDPELTLDLGEDEADPSDGRTVSLDTDDEDKFEEFLRNAVSSEAPEETLRNLKTARPSLNYNAARPGSALNSLPAGAKLEDYL